MTIKVGVPKTSCTPLSPDVDFTTMPLRYSLLFMNSVSLIHDLKAKTRRESSEYIYPIQANKPLLYTVTKELSSAANFPSRSLFGDSVTEIDSVFAKI